MQLPDYGLAQTQSDPVCHSAGCTQYNFNAKTKAKEDAPVQYPTNQKLEGDVINTWDNLATAEKIKGHEWVYKQEVMDKKDEDEVTQYDTDAKLDDDIVNTQGHLSTAEKKMGEWDIFKLKKSK